MACRKRLKTLDDLRRYLAATINKLDSGELDEAGAKSRAYICNILASIIGSSSLEDRVKELEKLVAGRQEKPGRRLSICQ